MSENLAEFFLRITNTGILPYQERYGEEPFRSTLLIIPTGLGKTRAAVAPWLHAVATARPGTPRRLVYVSPRRNLTGQTTADIRTLVKAVGIEGRIDVLELMGSSGDNKKQIEPDRFTVIVGTQDLIVSRALNRGYARKAPRWPMDFALLNNDCLWVMDEVQLTADSLATSAQLAAFREQFGVFGAAPCVWMSATVDAAWLDTVDFRSLRAAVRVIKLEPEDREQEIVRKRIHAAKTLERAPESCRTPEGCAEFVVEQHKAGERTLVIANTVQRARDIFAQLRKRGCQAVLLHSRFRPVDRDKHLREIKAAEIIVSTQVLEAGIDISVQRLITDIAPWGSLVQRFGRVNRYGELAEGRIWWVDLPTAAKGLYEIAELERAAAILAGITSAAPADLRGESGPAPWQYALRRSDLLDLFDTSSDISGNDLDISRFVRAGEDKDCYVAWRSWATEAELDAQPDIEDEELCPVQIGDVKKFAKGRELVRWDFTSRKWEAVDPNRLWPGMVVLAQAEKGGYTEEEGWSPESKKRVDRVELKQPGAPEGDEDDPLSWVTYRQTLVDHTRMVCEELHTILDNLNDLNLGEFRSDLETAAAKHDWGKAHPVMQATLHNSEPLDFNAPGFEFLAKQKRGDADGRHGRAHFRHELASALAMLAAGDSDLACYLAAAHHGRVRVNIRSMPGEREVGKMPVARGIREGDRLAPCEIAPGVCVRETTLGLNAMDFGAGEGAESWTDRMIRLRDRVGPFRLAFLEMLLRTADERASNKKGKEVAACAT